VSFTASQFNVQVAVSSLFPAGTNR